MSTPQEYSSQPPKQRDPDFVNAETAIKRASLKARERAKKLGME